MQIVVFVLDPQNKLLPKGESADLPKIRDASTSFISIYVSHTYDNIIAKPPTPPENTQESNIRKYSLLLLGMVHEAVSPIPSILREAKVCPNLLTELTVPKAMKNCFLQS